ncbi:conserved hypothetical protein [Abyssogena phaseoliformis symbiont OG214]|uniref:PP0621 family protein n=1 Tax=Abyssogena phaseoliformis symbiont TaxID=596095 RepID=UPI0019154968|nr:PP0621 family protein [Abyssogena phaseoliformis symbiont]MBW5289767.1 hypothetical protein [Candidatus Ruthia sp. Apha_13_S6]BBB23050.1 conserved hypothetical protein [Abyssogena phaseoliformis symbiont OG214]
MGIVKLIIIVLLVWAGFWLLKKFRKPVDRIDQKSSANKMLACSVCKVHIPENEAIIQNNKVYCSKEHLE